MGEKVEITAEERKILGKKVKQLRKQGMVPAIIYGGSQEPLALVLPRIEAEKMWRTAGRRHPVELTVGSHKHLAMVKSADHDPVKHSLRHLSFQAIKQNEKVTTEVPLRVQGEGETAAERAGLVVLKTIESVEIEALPKYLPDFMEIANAKLQEPGDHVSVADIIPVDGVTVMNDPAQVVATVYEPSALAAKNEAAGGGEEEQPEAEEAETAESEAAAGEEKKPEGETKDNKKEGK